MKHLNLKRNLAGILLAALLLTASAWAADNPAPGKGSLELQQPTTVGGTQLPSGKYRVEWTPNGDKVDVKIYSGSKEVATTTARLVKADGAAYNNISFITDEKGARSLTQISFSKQKSALRLGDLPAEAEQAAK